MTADILIIGIFFSLVTEINVVYNLNGVDTAEERMDKVVSISGRQKDDRFETHRNDKKRNEGRS